MNWTLRTLRPCRQRSRRPGCSRRSTHGKLLGTEWLESRCTPSAAWHSTALNAVIPADVQRPVTPPALAAVSVEASAASQVALSVHAAIQSDATPAASKAAHVAGTGTLTAQAAVSRNVVAANVSAVVHRQASADTDAASTHRSAVATEVLAGKPSDPSGNERFADRVPIGIDVALAVRADVGITAFNQRPQDHRESSGHVTSRPRGTPGESSSPVPTSSSAGEVTHDRSVESAVVIAPTKTRSPHAQTNRAAVSVSVEVTGRSAALEPAKDEPQASNNAEVALVVSRFARLEVAAKSGEESGDNESSPPANPDGRTENSVSLPAVVPPAGTERVLLAMDSRAATASRPRWIEASAPSADAGRRLAETDVNVDRRTDADLAEATGAEADKTDSGTNVDQLFAQFQPELWDQMGSVGAHYAKVFGGHRGVNGSATPDVARDSEWSYSQLASLAGLVGLTLSGCASQIARSRRVRRWWRWLQGRLSPQLPTFPQAK